MVSCYNTVEFVLNDGGLASWFYSYVAFQVITGLICAPELSKQMNMIIFDHAVCLCALVCVAVASVDIKK